MNLLKKWLLNLKIQKKKSIKNNLIYNKKTEARSLKDFRNYQNPFGLFKNSRDGNVNPREVLKNQIKIKLNLVKIRKGNPDFKSEEQIIVINNIENVLT